MTAKEYLSQVGVLNSRINNRKRQLEDLKLKTMLTSGTDYATDRVKSSLPLDPVADKIAEYVALEARINKLIAEYIDLREHITEQINMLEDKRYITLLGKRYLEDMPLSVVADQMGYEYKYTCLLHGKALQTFAKRFL